jgi:hypothetical protein
MKQDPINNFRIKIKDRVDNNSKKKKKKTNSLT